MFRVFVLQVAWYRLFCRVSSGSNVRVRLNDYFFPGTGIQVRSVPRSYSVCVCVCVCVFVCVFVCVCVCMCACLLNRAVSVSGQVCVPLPLWC